MDTKFDFKQVGKRMPYTTPDDFFRDMEKNILEAVKEDSLKAYSPKSDSLKSDSSKPDSSKPIRIQPRKRPFIKMIWTAAIAVAASVAVLLVLNIDFSAPHSSLPSQGNNELQMVDQAFAQLSSADQAYLLEVYQEDVFLNH
nr:hypothetical protein [uncultured Prevotella sp.]